MYFSCAVAEHEKWTGELDGTVSEPPMRHTAGVMAQMAARYHNAAARAPVLVQSASAGCIAAVGDCLMQKIEGETWDAARTARIAAFRLLVFGPAYSIWMRTLEKKVRLPQTKAVVAKIALDQLIWTPPSLMTFYFSMACMEGRGIHEGAERAKTMLWPTLRINWPFWSCVQLVTFSVVPVQHRVVWVSFVHVGWNAFVSGLNQQARVASLEKPRGSESTQSNGAASQRDPRHDRIDL